MNCSSLIKKCVSKLNLYAFEYVNRYKWMRITYKNMLGSFDAIKPLTYKQTDRGTEKDMGEICKEQKFFDIQPIY